MFRALPGPNLTFMCQDSERPKTTGAPARKRRGGARERLAQDLAAMFESVAAQPLPDDLLNLVDQLEAQGADGVRPAPKPDEDGSER